MNGTEFIQQIECPGSDPTRTPVKNGIPLSAMQKGGFRVIRIVDFDEFR